MRALTDLRAAPLSPLPPLAPPGTPHCAPAADESLQLAWQLQQEELQLSGQQLSGFRAPRPDGGGSPHSPHMEEEEP